MKVSKQTRNMIAGAMAGFAAVAFTASPAAAEDKSYAAALAKALEEGRKNATRGVSLGIRG